VKSEAEFNYEIEKRVIDRLSQYMTQAVNTNKIISNYRYSGGFPHGLRAQDRDEYLRLDNSLPMPLIYYGMEDGSISGYYKGGQDSFGYYREPGNSGYAADDPTMAKHLNSCIDKDGTPTECVLNPGSQYVRCIDDCKLELCPDEESQTNCSLIGDADAKADCLAKQKWCPQYTIETYSGEGDDNAKLGYLPITNFCHDVHGLFTQEVGKVVKGYTPSTYDLAAVVSPTDGSSSVHELGNCYYADGKTLVNRTLSGNYAYCGGNGEVCATTFAGGYESFEYDPRYRPWYIDTKATQKAEWLDPYPFFELGMGITYTHPIYDIVDGKNVFAGVLAVDYRFEDITEFLVESYGGASTYVAIFEDKEPNYIIALSTGTLANTLALSDDPSKPCHVDSGNDIPCDPIRIEMAKLSGTPNDDVLFKSYQKHKDAEYPKELITVGASEGVDGDVYLSQSSLYEQLDANLRWRIVVASPGDRSDSDAIMPGDALFNVLIAVSILGVALCIVLFTIFYSKRKKRAVLYSDYRFTCAFIGGCALFNCSTLTLIGPNSDPLCLLRMWSFHMLLVTALAPLFVKVWRMWRLVGSTNIRRVSISHMKTALYMLPMISIQFLILLIISLVDPPKQSEEIKISDNTITQHLVCAHNTKALDIIEVVYEAGLVIIGCVLSFQTRNMDKKFGESKQLIFSMYTWLLVSFVFYIIIMVADISPNGEALLQGIGVLWTSVFSSAAFVVPRLIQVRADSTSKYEGAQVNHTFSSAGPQESNKRSNGSVPKLTRGGETFVGNEEGKPENETIDNDELNINV